MKNYTMSFVISFLIINCSTLTGQIKSHTTVFGKSLNFEINKISDRVNGYDYQSDASPQQVWYDVNHPGNMHAVFAYSQVPSPWMDRSSLYFGSTNEGETWFELGQVPVNNGINGRSGYPAIYGNSLGAAVIMNHNSSNSTPTISKLYIDSAIFAYKFGEYDPLAITGNPNEPIWPRLVVDANDNAFFISSQWEGGDSADCYLNFFNNATKTFSGWQPLDGDNGESYALAVSDGGKIGVTWYGRKLSGNKGDVFYMETTDEGITWAPRLKIFDRPDNQDTAKGAFKGISLSFYGEEPCIVFDVCMQDFISGNHFPELPSEIYFWSPNVNGGVSKVIADSSNIPFAPALTCYFETSYYSPLCKPVIGRSETGNFLFAAINTATDSVLEGYGFASYFACYFMYSSDGGDSWSLPEKFTPDTPLTDWRFVSIAPINPVVNNYCTVHLVLQGDPYPGLNSDCYPIPPVSAQPYHGSTEIVITDVKSEPKNFSSFKLEQNYPNPFNLTTKIKYSIPTVETHRDASLQVKLTVFDVLGTEIATLINEEKPAGSYQVSFDASGLPSGVYFYTLLAGELFQTRKMILLK